MEEWDGLKKIQPFLQQDDLEGAVRCLREELERTSHPIGWYNLGVLLKRKEDLLGALEGFEKAAELAPDEPEIWNEIGLIYDEQGRLTAAETYYKKALDLDPSFSRAWNNWGVTAFLREDFAEAKKRFEKACVLDPESISAWFNLRDTLAQLDDKPGVARAQKKLDQLGASEDE